MDVDSASVKSAGGYSSINLTSVFRFGAEEWRALNSKGIILVVLLFLLRYQVLITFEDKVTGYL
jgi:hypothetical protein